MKLNLECVGRIKCFISPNTAEFNHLQTSIDRSSPHYGSRTCSTMCLSTQVTPLDPRGTHRRLAARHCWFNCECNCRAPIWLQALSSPADTPFDRAGTGRYHPTLCTETPDLSPLLSLKVSTHAMDRWDKTQRSPLRCTHGEAKCAQTTYHLSCRRFWKSAGRTGDRSWAFSHRIPRKQTPPLNSVHSSWGHCLASYQSLSCTGTFRLHRRWKFSWFWPCRTRK